jgi:hypothetical protein
MSNLGMTLSFTQVCAGDIIRVGSDSFFVGHKCTAEHYVTLMPVGQSANPRRVYESEFNKLQPVLVAEEMKVKKK